MSSSNRHEISCLAITEENNGLFPDRQVTEKKVAISTGIMNLLGPMVGAAPMCHGARGMAGHARFGARTRGAPIILGGLLVVVALFFSGSTGTIASRHTTCSNVAG